MDCDVTVPGNLNGSLNNLFPLFYFCILLSLALEFLPTSFDRFLCTFYLITLYTLEHRKAPDTFVYSFSLKNKLAKKRLSTIDCI